jgi:hypothetical protein
VIAAVGTWKGPADALKEVARLSDESVGPWLRAYEGYRGTFVFVDAEREVSQVITLWDSAEHELAARGARAAMRDQLAELAGLEVVDFGVYEVAAHELVSG